MRELTKGEKFDETSTFARATVPAGNVVSNVTKTGQYTEIIEPGAARCFGGPVAPDRLQQLAKECKGGFTAKKHPFTGSCRVEQHDVEH